MVWLPLRPLDVGLIGHQLAILEEVDAVAGDAHLRAPILIAMALIW